MSQINLLGPDTNILGLVSEQALAPTSIDPYAGFTPSYGFTREPSWADTVFAKVSRDAQSTREINVFGKAAIRSIAHWITPLDDVDNVAVPYDSNKVYDLIERSTLTAKDMDRLSGTDFYNVISDNAQAFLESQGVTEDNFKDRTFEEAELFYQQRMLWQGTLDLIDAYEEENGWFSTGVTNFGISMVTDPFVLATLGLAGPARGVATNIARRAATNSATRTVALNAAKLSTALGRGESFMWASSYWIQNAKALQIIQFSAGAALGAGINLTAQYANNQTLMSMDYDPEQFSVGSLALSSLFVGSLSWLVGRSFAKGNTKARLPYEDAKILGIGNTAYSRIVNDLIPSRPTDGVVPSRYLKGIQYENLVKLLYNKYGETNPEIAQLDFFKHPEVFDVYASMRIPNKSEEDLVKFILEKNPTIEEIKDWLPITGTERILRRENKEYFRQLKWLSNRRVKQERMRNYWGNRAQKIAEEQQKIIERRVKDLRKRAPKAFLERTDTYHDAGLYRYAHKNLHPFDKAKMKELEVKRIKAQEFADKWNTRYNVAVRAETKYLADLDLKRAAIRQRQDNPTTRFQRAIQRYNEASEELAKAKLAKVAEPKGGPLAIDENLERTQRINQATGEYLAAQKELNAVRDDLLPLSQSTVNEAVAKTLDEVVERSRTREEQATLLEILLNEDAVADIDIINTGWGSRLSKGVRKKQIEKISELLKFNTAESKIFAALNTNNKLIGWLSNLVYSPGAVPSLAKSGEYIPNIMAQKARADRSVAPVMRSIRKLRNKGLSEAEIQALFKEVIRYKAGEIKVVSDDVSELTDEFFKFFENYRVKGLRNGYFLEGQDLANFVPTPLTRKGHENSRVLIDKLYAWYKARFDPTVPTHELHYGTLRAMNIIQLDEFGSPVFASEILEAAEKMPTTVEELAKLVEPRVMEEYTRRINSTDINDYSIFRDADAAMQRKMGLTPVSPDSDQILLRDLNTIRKHSSSKNQRSIEQEFFLQKEIFDKGYIETDVALLTQNYGRTVGTQINIQDSIFTMFGRKDITLEGLAETIKRKVVRPRPDGTVPTPEEKELYTALVDDLLNTVANLTNSRRIEGRDRSTDFLNLVSSVGAIPVQVWTGPAQAMIETPFKILTELMPKRLFIDTLSELVRSFNRKEEVDILVQTGIDYLEYVSEARMLPNLDVETNRNIYNWKDRYVKPIKRGRDAVMGKPVQSYTASQNKGLLNRALYATEAVGDLLRNVGFEDQVTNFGRRLTANIAVRRFQKDVKKLGNISRALDAADFLNLNATQQSRILNGLAKRNNIPVDVLREYLAFGLLNKDLADYLDKVDVSWFDNKNLHRLDLDTDPRGSILRERLSDHVAREVDVWITRGTAINQPLNQTAYNAFLTKFFTFMRAWSSGIGRRIYNMNGSQGFGSLVIYTALEAMYSAARRWVNGETVEDIQQDWEENWERMIFATMARSPILGPVTNMVFALTQELLTGEASRNPSRSVGSGVFTDYIRNIRQIYESFTTDDAEWEHRDIARLQKHIPGLNAWPVQILRRLMFEVE